MQSKKRFSVRRRGISRKRRRHIHRQRGGNTAKAATLEEFQTILSSKPLATYDYIYISIGSAKHDENILGFGTPIPNDKWHYQIYPGWLRNRRNVLLIIIDGAKTDETVSQLEPILAGQGVQLIAYAQNYNGASARFLMNTLREQNVNPEKCMICNYAKLKNTSLLSPESQAINELANGIKFSVVSTPYKDRLYVWMGYDYLYLIQPVLSITDQERYDIKNTMVRRYGLNRSANIATTPYARNDKYLGRETGILKPVLDITYTEDPNPSLGDHYSASVNNSQMRPTTTTSRTTTVRPPMVSLE